MNKPIPIHGRGNFPTLEVRLKDFVSVVRSKLEGQGVHVRDIRLNGGAASYVLLSPDDYYYDADGDPDHECDHDPDADSYYNPSPASLSPLLSADGEIDRLLPLQIEPQKKNFRGNQSLPPKNE